MFYIQTLCVAFGVVSPESWCGQRCDDQNKDETKKTMGPKEGWQQNEDWINRGMRLKDRRDQKRNESKRVIRPKERLDKRRD